jgi:enterochelin esterase-like enzyme
VKAALASCAALTLYVALVLVLPAPAVAADRVALHEWMIAAPSLHMDRRSVIVYLPPSYDRPEAASRRYPMLMLLHGEPGWNGDWPRNAHVAALLDSLIARHRMPEVIALMPDADGPGPGGRSLYVNSFDGRLRMEDFLTMDVLAWADRTFRTRARASARALVGVSDGANAAINLAFKHPDLFGACAGHSGEYAWKHVPHMPAVLGEEPGASRLLRENSPVLYVGTIAPRLARLDIYFDAGLLDLAFWDDRNLDRELTELHVPHVYHEYWGWHEWGAWRSRLAISLPFVTRRMW